MAARGGRMGWNRICGVTSWRHHHLPTFQIHLPHESPRERADPTDGKRGGGQLGVKFIAKKTRVFNSYFLQNSEFVYKFYGIF